MVLFAIGVFEVKSFGMNGGPGEVRTLDLMTARQHGHVYLTDFAAHLATVKHAKTPLERSGGT